MEKAQIRKEVFKKRAELSPEEEDLKNSRLYENLKKVLEDTGAEVIYLYASYHGEAGTKALLKECLREEIPVFAPRVCEDKVHMEFYRITSQNDLVEGYKGIPEPSMECVRDNVDTRKKAVIIVPGVAFSRHGDRVGYGKGFYDRYFHTHSFQKKIGIAFDFQIYEEIKTMPDDIPMDILVTESGILYI